MSWWMKAHSSKSVTLYEILQGPSTTTICSKSKKKKRSKSSNAKKTDSKIWRSKWSRVCKRLRRLNRNWRMTKKTITRSSLVAKWKNRSTASCTGLTISTARGRNRNTIAAWSNTCKTSLVPTKSAVAPKLRSPASKWVRESCWKSNCFGRWRTILTRSWIRMPGTKVRMTICILWGTAKASTTTPPPITPTSMTTWATWKVPRASTRTGFCRRESRLKHPRKRCGPRAGESHSPKEMCHTKSMIATCAEGRGVRTMTFIGRWDL